MPTMPAYLVAGKQREDHDQWVHAHGAADDVGCQDVAFELLDCEENDDHDQSRGGRVKEGGNDRGHCADPGSHVGYDLSHAGPETKEQRVLAAFWPDTDDVPAQYPDRQAGSQSDGTGQQELTSDKAAEGRLQPADVFVLDLRGTGGQAGRESGRCACRR